MKEERENDLILQVHTLKQENDALREQLARQAPVIEAASEWVDNRDGIEPDGGDEVARAVATMRALSVPAPPKVCATCGGYPVAYKQFRVGDRFWTKDCPDCAVPAPPEAPCAECGGTFKVERAVQRIVGRMYAADVTIKVACPTCQRPPSILRGAPPEAPEVTG